MWQSDRVQTWVVVMIAVVAVALVLTVYGALSDRAKNRRRAAEMLGPPQRDIPNLPDGRPVAAVRDRGPGPAASGAGRPRRSSRARS